ncbi:MAG: RNA methyltransferase [Acidimicrobiia bacterium]|jgi:TrmH family RNA methyltransferase
MRIDSTANERIKAVRRLHRGRERRRTIQTIIEGPNLVAAALEAGIVPHEIYTVEGGMLAARCEAAGSNVVEISAPVLGVISTTVEPQDPVGVISIPRHRPIGLRRTVVAVEISDPGNLGTLIRSAGALGWQIALIGGADPWSPKVMRASAGVQLTHPAIALESFSQLRGAGLEPIATTVSGGIDPGSLDIAQPIALLIGNESHGLPAGMVEQCAALVTIPLAEGVESLNASVAATIVMYALGREQTTE